MKHLVNNAESIINFRISSFGVALIIIGLLMAVLEIFVFQNAQTLLGKAFSLVAAAAIVFGWVLLYEEFKAVARQPER